MVSFEFREGALGYFQESRKDLNREQLTNDLKNDFCYEAENLSFVSHLS